MSDISHKLQNQKLLDLDIYKNKMLASVNHDLRTPLNCISTIINLLESFLHPDFQKEGKKYLEMAAKSCELLLSTINDILDQAQILNGKLNINNQRCDIK